MKRLRYVTDADVRFSSSGNIIAAPVWAYEISYFSGKHYHQIEQLWAPFYERRKAEGEQKERDRKELIERCVRIALDPNSTDSERDYAKLIVTAHKVGARNRSERPAASLQFPSYHAIKVCRVCGNEFFGLGATTTCTPACHSARRKATRTRGAPRIRCRVVHEMRRCDHCREGFTPQREDARFCSSRCRVAEFRWKLQDGP
jgi:hypothetical protein